MLNHPNRVRQPKRSAFITTIAVAATAVLTGAGCNLGVTSNPPPATCDFGEPGCDDSCPTTEPADGQYCAQVGQACEYGSYCEGDSKQAACGEDGTWNVVEDYGTCNPPPPDPECPSSMPLHGDACDTGWIGPYECNYADSGCPGADAIATCNADGTWDVSVPICNPPPAPSCPEELPEDGGACESSEMGAYDCMYDDPECEDLTLSATCGAEGTWSIPDMPCESPPSEGP